MKKSDHSLFGKIADYLTSRFDKSVSGTAMKQLLVLFTVFTVLYLFWLAVFQLFFYHYTGMVNKDIPGTGWSIIAQMIDPGNQHMIGAAKAKDTDTIIVDWQLRLLVLLISLTGAFAFGGLLISTISNVFDRRVAIIREGLMSYRYKNHVVILGCNNIVMGLLNQILCEPGYVGSKIVVLTSRNVSELKRLLASEFPKQKMKRIDVLFGDRSSRNDLERVWIHLSKEIFIPGENNEPDHDSKNNACVKQIESILDDYFPNEYDLKQLDCNVMFDSQTTHAAHQFLNLQCSNPSDKRRNHLNVNSFSFYEKWAQKVFVACKHENTIYPPLDFETISPDSDKYVHVIIAGMTRMGFALGVQAARLGHYANYKRQKTRITFIDSHADRESNYFASRFQSFYNSVDVHYEDAYSGEKLRKQGTLPFINIELNFINGHFESKQVREKLVNWTSDPDALTTIAICFYNPANCLAAGLYLPDKVYENKAKVLVQQETGHSILSLLFADDPRVDNRYENVRAFGMVNDCIDINLQSSFKAMAVNYFYSSFSFPAELSDEDYRMMRSGWNVLKERYKWSSRYNADSFPGKCRAIGAANADLNQLPSYFSDLNNIGLLTEMEHARWNVDALLAGYAPPEEEVIAESGRTADRAWDAFVSGGKDENNPVFIKLKNAHSVYINGNKKKMIHPCLIPFDQLSEYYKDIDRKLVSCIPIIEKSFNELDRLEDRSC